MIETKLGIRVVDEPHDFRDATVDGSRGAAVAANKGRIP
jgi:hypothetical protein